MATRSSRGGRSGNYIFGFVGVAALLVAITLVLVLYVLPERYVFSSGFREGNLSLPSPSVPFEPAPPLRIAAIPTIAPVPAGPDSIVRGPAELFWERVLPMLEAGRNREALPLFVDYLSVHPGDVGVRREYAVTLAAAGQPERAIPILEGLLVHEGDDELYLLLARTLRDAGRVEEASERYALLAEAAPDDEALTLEWARALSWLAEYERAEAVLLRALEAHPGSVPLRAELGRVYYYADRIEDAEDVFASLTDEEIDAQDLAEARANVALWLAEAADSLAEEPPPPPTLLEQAVAAREDDDFERADSLFEAALAEDPGSADAWSAYADFLQYEVEDLAGALEALGEVERLRADADPALQYRMAQLEVWTDDYPAARERLGGMLAGMEAEGPPTRADVLTLLGDLDRWTGARLSAVARYETALDEDPEHERASEGLDALRAEVDRTIIEAEQPGLGAVASSFADTDEYRRFDAGGAWRGVHGDWVWATRSGGRWIEGFEPMGGEGSRSGLFAELEGARWWRWGTIRTGAHLGLQSVRSSAVDVGLGASARLVGPSGRRTDLRFDHEPAYPLTNTLQSAAANVWQDRITLGHGQPLSERWSAAVSAEAASLEHRDVPAADRNLRLAVGASVARVVSGSVSVGLSARALRYMDAAPDATAVPLYWDPSASVSVGPFAQWARPLGTSWDVTARINPGLAWIDERRRPGSEVVPDLSGSLGLLREGTTYRTGIELSYGQGRFSGYRSFGVSLSFSARGWLGPGGER